MGAYEPQSAPENLRLQLAMFFTQWARENRRLQRTMASSGNLRTSDSSLRGLAPWAPENLKLHLIFCSIFSLEHWRMEVTRKCVAKQWSAKGFAPELWKGHHSWAAEHWVLAS